VHLRSALVSALLLAGCHPVAPPAPDVADPAALLARARAEAAPSPAFAQFSAVLTTPQQSMSLSGTLVVAPPDRFRVELRGPIGPAQVIVTCNGKDVSAFIAPKNTYYRAYDADGTLGRLLAGGEGLRGAAVATSLLLGRLPELPTAPTLTAVGPVATAAWTRSDGASFNAGFESRFGHLVDARATDAHGVVLFSGAWEPAASPTALRVKLPTLGASADVRFDAWQAASPADAAFQLEPPPGAIVKVLDLSGAPEAEPAR